MYSSDPMILWYITRKYGTRWRRIVKSRSLARRETRGLLEGVTPLTSDSHSDSSGPLGESQDPIEVHHEEHGEDGRRTPAPVGPPQPPQTPRSVPLPQTPGTSTYTDEDERKRLEREEVANTWDRGFKDWLKKVPEDEDDERWYYYQFLGEAYVHGMMDGEAMEYQNTQDIKTSLFELR
jgi:hypothetical protein